MSPCRTNHATMYRKTHRIVKMYHFTPRNNLNTCYIQSNSKCVLKIVCISLCLSFSLTLVWTFPERMIATHSLTAATPPALGMSIIEAYRHEGSDEIPNYVFPAKILPCIGFCTCSIEIHRCPSILRLTLSSLRPFPICSVYILLRKFPNFGDSYTVRKWPLLFEPLRARSTKIPICV